ncbi:23S rRNA (adenine(1618)-N(6))-methyltransferase RlmF [Vibrio nigripulchritudo]|uniref:23S rRNA (adenine(1618)-N(6))-methyltransferase RlmF n=1 Tax=Vibrio nigripulchritudo TaxID=28173 RepID=UPI0005F9EAFA|nr:23S rRNA (adenine(1618)-N(6))-methyltransferase RlmF [Vibrio nigripulchritudo]KJY76856.1 23S rRNA methyltransferase [Vibrio nigripulchritudo]
MPSKSQSKASDKTAKTKVIKKRFGALHKRNPHKGKYHFPSLCKASPELQKFVIKTVKGDESINFSDEQAVIALNRALLAKHYSVTKWGIPKGFLCPPLPGRADYIHHISDLLINVPKEYEVTGLDIGTGANGVYPIVGISQYNWLMRATDIDPKSVANVKKIADNNPSLKSNLSVELQSDPKCYFRNILKPDERVDFTMCNPPFHKSLQEAAKGTERKLKNLSQNRAKKGSEPKSTASKLNFGGQKAELWCPGGEEKFIRNMAFESKHFAKQCLWFTTLVSKKDNVRPLRKALEKLEAHEVRIVEMTHGQKITRFVAWTFLDEHEQANWFVSK